MTKAKLNSNKSAAKSAKPRNTSKQRDLVVVMILSLLLGLGGGYLLGTVAADNITNSTANSQMETTSPHMHGDLYEVPANKAPKVDLVVVEDAKSGYNIKIITTDFTFAPEKVNGENVVGEGHAHLYVDGEKIGRVYGEYYHYSSTFEGTKTFRVTLNANNHSDYAVDGKVIEAMVDVTHDSSNPQHNDMHMKSKDMRKHSE
jgi:hypothetical protein